MKDKHNKYLILLVVALILFMSVGYAALNRELNITGEITYRPEENIRVVDFQQKNATSMNTKYSNFSKKEVKVAFTPLVSGATATYEVKVKNNNGSVFVISNIQSNLDEGLTYEIDYDVANAGGIDAKGEMTFNITFKYTGDVSGDITKNAVLTFDFEIPTAEMLKYANSQYTTCTNVQCALDELYALLR